MVHCIVLTSSSLLMVLSAQGQNFSGIVKGADMQGSPSVGISMDGWVDRLMSYSSYSSVMVSNFFFVSGDSVCFPWCCTGLFIQTWSLLIMKSSVLLVFISLTSCGWTLSSWMISCASSSDGILPFTRCTVPMCCPCGIHLTSSD